jgi:hypothetical protein
MVIPAKAGVHESQRRSVQDSRFHGNDRKYFYCLAITSSGWQILPLIALAAATAGLDR